MKRAAVKAAMRMPRSNNKYEILSSACVDEVATSEHFHIPITLGGRQHTRNVVAMVDSGASTLFLNRRFVEEHSVRTVRLDQPIPLYNIDHSSNAAGSIKSVAPLEMSVGTHRERAIFSVTDIGTEDVIIGIDWLRDHNPEIDWDQGTLRLSRCPDSCKSKIKLEVTKPTSTTSDTKVRLTARCRASKVPKTKSKAKAKPTWAPEVDEQPSTSEDTQMEDVEEDVEEEEEGGGLPEEVEVPHQWIKANRRFRRLCHKESTLR